MQHTTKWLFRVNDTILMERAGKFPHILKKSLQYTQNEYIMSLDKDEKIRYLWKKTVEK